MTVSAPRDFTKATCAALQTAVTSAPKDEGSLNRSSPDTARSATDQHVLPAVDLAFSQKIQGGHATPGNGGGFLIGQIGRFDGQSSVFRQAEILGIRAKIVPFRSKHLVTLPKALDSFAHCFDFPGKHTPQYSFSGVS